MNIEEIKKNLENLYLDYYDGLYSEKQLKIVLLNLYKQLDITDLHWAELILDAQWKHATDQDYEDKINQLKEETREEEE